jgi:hypothetical protein
MAQIPRQVKCPSCQAPIEAQVEQLLDVAQDPSAKSRLLSGNLNLVSCPVCGFSGQLSSPLVYHDPAHELLLTFIPVELAIPKDEQERMIGRLINQVTTSLPAEERKAYLLQPQAILTMQGLVERVLEADGISKEEIEAQRARMRLFEDFLRLPEENLETFIQENDEAIDAGFLQLASLTLQATENEQARQAVGQRLERLLELSSFGQQLRVQEEALREAAESLSALGDQLTHDALLDMIIDAPSEQRVVALVNLTRPALDYTFFQKLTERIDAADTDEKERLKSLRSNILEITEQIDQVQEARASQASSLLNALIQADDLEQAVAEAMPAIDDLFLGILQANISAASEKGNQDALARLNSIQAIIERFARESLPEGIRLAQQLLDAESDEEVESLLREQSDQIDEQMLNALLSTAEKLAESQNEDGAERLRDLYRRALKASMRAKMRADD